jgi:hypothetical protein
MVMRVMRVVMEKVVVMVVVEERVEKDVVGK